MELGKAVKYDMKLHNLTSDSKYTFNFSLQYWWALIEFADGRAL